MFQEIIKNNICQKISILRNSLCNNDYQLTYISENNNWAIKYVGQNLKYFLNNNHLLKTRISTCSENIRNQIIHYGCEYTFNNLPYQSNHYGVSIFHFIPNSQKISTILANQNHFSFIHTSTTLTKKALISNGFLKNKIFVIPLGINLSVFNLLFDKNKKRVQKVKYNLPTDRFIIGSFQKDGNGWNKGLTPKLVKGPDIFIKVIEKLPRDRIFVLLTGPARGYLKEELKKRNIPYKHFYYKNPQKISKIINLSDLCLITSRVEGGPLQLLEAMACGIPIITTDVGMAHDIFSCKEKPFLMTKSENVPTLIKYCLNIIENKIDTNSMVKKSLDLIKQYSWENIAMRYYEKLYKPLL